MTEIPDDPYIESTGYWQDVSVDQSDDDVWKTTDMGWGVYPEVTSSCILLTEGRWKAAEG